jgi:tryptophan synthase alpha chain
MTYYNPVFCFGEERFLRQAKLCGVDGVILPDFPPEEGKEFIKLANKYNIDLICFIAPTTQRERIKYIASIARGFIYYVSLTGVTGPRRNLPGELKDNLAMVKRYTHKPICVGFGVSTNFQVREIHKIADGVIVGSAIVHKIKENIGNSRLVKRVSDFVLRLKG